MYANKMMRAKFGTGQEEVKRGYEKFHNMERLTIHKQPPRCNNNSFINSFNQLNIFRAIISPILRSTRLCLQFVV